MCEKDKDIEGFLKHKALQLKKLGKSRTFIVCDENSNDFKLLSYFTIALQILKVPEASIRSNYAKKLDGCSSNFHGTRITDFPAILIGQIGKMISFVTKSPVLNYLNIA